MYPASGRSQREERLNVPLQWEESVRGAALRALGVQGARDRSSNSQKRIPGRAWSQRK